MFYNPFVATSQSYIGNQLMNGPLEKFLRKKLIRGYFCQSFELRLVCSVVRTMEASGWLFAFKSLFSRLEEGNSVPFVQSGN